MLDHVTVAVGNRAEVEVAVGTSDPARGRRRVCSTAAWSWPWSRWAARACSSRPPRAATVVSPHPVEVVCGLGAGDAFGGALVHGLLAGWDPVTIAGVRQRRRRDRGLPAGLRRRHAHPGRAPRRSSPRQGGSRMSVVEARRRATRDFPRSPTTEWRDLLERRATDPGADRQGVRRPASPGAVPLRPRHLVPGRRRPPGSGVARLGRGRDGDGRPAFAALPARRGPAAPRRRRRARHARHHRGAAAARRARGQGRDRFDEPRRPRRRHLDDGRPVHRVRRGQHRGLRPRGRQDAAAHRRLGLRDRRHDRGLRAGGQRAGRAPAGGHGRAAALRARRGRDACSCARTALPCPARSRSPPGWAPRVPTPG